MGSVGAITCPAGFTKATPDKCLKYESGARNFQDADNYCKSITYSQGGLAEIRDQETLNYILSQTAGKCFCEIPYFLILVKIFTFKIDLTLRSIVYFVLKIFPG